MSNIFEPGAGIVFDGIDTPEALAKAIERLHDAALFGPFSDDADSRFDPIANQELIACFSFLKLAQAAAMRAEYHQRRHIAHLQSKGMV